MLLGPRLRLLAVALVGGAVLLVGPLSASADGTPQALPFAQDWSNTELITTSDDWSGVPGIVGYRGDGLVSSTAVDPQTVLADGSATPEDVNANQASPNTFTTGGVSEFHLANPVVALQGSGTADAPHLVLNVNTTGAASVDVSYDLRDIDGSADNAVQPVALQYRVGATGNYTNVPAAFVADATTGPSLATLVTPVSVTLPAATANQPLVQLRIITTDAAGSDEWVGIDDISVRVTGAPPADAAPSVSSTSPAAGAVDVSPSSNVEITFSEPVAAGEDAFSIDCATSGAHGFALSGGPSTYALDPDQDFADGESCTVTVVASQVSDLDTNDPPDTMTADHTFSFSTLGASARINEIQGAAHISPLQGSRVSAVPGVVVARTASSFWMQDPMPDSDPATSDGLLVFGSAAAAAVAVGDSVLVNGTVTEFRPGGATGNNLTITELTSPSVAVLSTANALPAPTVVGIGGRMPPTEVIHVGSPTGTVETGAVFDPPTNGIDFYESLEGMRVRVDDAVASGPSNRFGEISLLPNEGSWAGTRTSRGGIVVSPGDFNPERVIVDDVLGPTPAMNVGDKLPGALVGVLDYSFGNFKLLATQVPAVVSGGLQREVAQEPRENELSIGTFNVENLSPASGAAHFAALANQIVNHLRSPDLLGIEEVQDNTGPTNNGVVAADQSWQALIDAIEDAGGPTYDYRQIDPVNNQDGGQPGGNIRVGFLFRTDRGLSFVDRPGGTSTNATEVVRSEGRAQLTFSPGRVDPANAAWTSSRKPLAGEFRWNDKTLIAVVNHFSSKGGDDPLYGRFQPPIRHTEVARHQQARVVSDFVSSIFAAEAKANVVVLGDINDFEFSRTVEILEESGLVNLMGQLPKAERYSYVFDGNSQVLDQILVSPNVVRAGPSYDVVHINSEFADQLSDHEPSVATTKLLGGGGGGSR